MSLQIILILLACVVGVMECAVLDPALYLSPSPPVKFSNTHSMWSLPTNAKGINADTEAALQQSRTFWPKVRTDYRLGGIHIPLTFSLSGTYGGQAADASAVIGNSYVRASGLTSAKIITSHSKPSLMSAQYDVFNSAPTVVRIYGGNNKPAWSGWGNGKWGHYGKG